jgi:elongation factor G
MNDPHLGKLTYVRSYSGVLEAGAQVLNATKDRKERIGKICRDARQQARGDRRRSAPATSSPSMGLKDTDHGRHAVRLRQAGRARVDDVPGRRSSRVAIEPKTKGDQEKLGTALQRLSDGGPDLPACAPTRRPARPSSPAWASCTSRSSSTACAASSRSRPTSASPQVAYRETITQEGREGRLHAQEADRWFAASTADVLIDSSPSPRERPGEGYEFVNAVTGGRIPEGVHPVGRRRASRTPWSAACSPATRWST